MADEDTTLEQPEPGTIPTSDATEPVDASEQDSSPDGSPGQPTPDTDSRLKRLEANLKGQQMALERERQEKERLRAELMARAQPAPPPPAPVDEVAEERDYQQALVDSNYARMKEIRDRQRARDLDRLRAENQAHARAYTEQQQRQASVVSYLQSRSLPTDQKSPFYKEVQARVQAASQDPAYYFAHDNPAALAAIITNEVVAERGINKEKAGEKARQATADSAFTEGSGNGTGSRPGQKAAGEEKIYLNDAEKKFVENRARKDGISLAAAQKKYWQFMNPDEKRRRTQARSA